MGMLDRLSVFDDDLALQLRVEKLLAKVLLRPSVPSRAELVRVASESLARVDANN